MKEFWSRRARALTPYTPGEQPRQRRLIKLNTNENPYPPSPRALEAIRAAAGEGLRLYPDPEAAELRETLEARLAEVMRLGTEISFPSSPRRRHSCSVAMAPAVV